MLEKEVMLQVKKILSQYEQTGEVEWWERLNSGKVRIGAHYIAMCRKGTPDFVAIVRNFSKQLSVVFIECKSDTGTLRPEQLDFCNNYNIKPGFHILTISEPKELRSFINSISYDFLQDLPLEL